MDVFIKSDITVHTQILKSELIKYYHSLNQSRENTWKNKLGQDLNWKLSFDNLKESNTTKHINRLHPYKGKFIPQFVEYFLDDQIGEFKKEKYFNKNAIILDHFAAAAQLLLRLMSLACMR
ncbi:hypothetical protein ATZ36_10875 [Candidatus Endomicrobiellum trichonymphae]|uniref:Uncharacterized protein n=1 Tax=Endomicrobium trichonymphae TaxID=1408204 RepID=A0A1E5IGR5_ENDTX|nr:hypothetical protein ATZ36_10875 [Candidatus Endomicrobium trichonymphae]